jgi:hypothetical protein
MISKKNKLRDSSLGEIHCDLLVRGHAVFVRSALARAEQSRATGDAVVVEDF